MQSQRFALKLDTRKVNGLIDFHHLSVARFSSAIGFDRKLVGRVLNGDEHPSDKLIAAISAVFKIPVHELIDSKPVLR